MSWNGSGVYSRGYASWTNDATNNLPISATKFDTEDNDFAAGINNCLCKDGQNSPTAALTWTIANASPLNLLRQTDGITFSVGRSGGSNNPIFQVIPYDASGITLNSTSGGFYFDVGNSPALVINSSGQLTVQGPTSGVALTVFGASGSYAQNIQGYGAGSGVSFGLKINAGTTSGDFALAVANDTGATAYFQVRGDGLGIFYNGVEIYGTNTFLGLTTIISPASGEAFAINNNANTQQFFYVNAAGGVVIANVPAGTAGLYVTGASGNNVLQTNSVAAGPALAAYTTAATQLTGLQMVQSGQHTLQIINPASTNDIDFVDTTYGSLAYLSPGGAAIGAGTSLQGAGTLNIGNGLYVANSPIYSGIPVNSQSASYTAVLSDANKCIRAGSGSPTITIPANASVAYPLGTAITFANRTGGGTVTIAINSDTLVFAETGGTGSRSLASNGLATAIKVDPTLWLISGAGLS